jgi:predicted short-subunit dehydrogenase-like oxidoreductase (DUF2520 family)
MTKTFALIGAGKIGFALSGLLTRSGWKVARVLDTSKEAEMVYKSTFSSFFTPDRFPECLYICIKDDHFSQCLDFLTQNPEWKSPHIIHTSGYHKAKYFLPVQEKYDVEIHSFHPMISVIDTDPVKGEKLLKKAWWALSGDNPPWMKELMESLGLHYRILEDDKKDYYHAAAVMTANLIIGVLRAAESTAQKAGISPEEYEKIYLPLVDSVVGHIHKSGLQHALGGPIVRKDFDLLAREIKALSKAGLKDESAIYELVSSYLIRIVHPDAST